MDNVCYFAGTEPDHGAELWRSGGTAGGTFMVKDIQPGTDGSGPRPIAQIDSSLYLFAGLASETFSGACDLWKTDGTSETTVMVKHFSDIIEPELAPHGSVTAVVGSDLYFSASDGTSSYYIWKSQWNRGRHSSPCELPDSYFFPAACWMTTIGSKCVYIASGELCALDAAGNRTELTSDPNWGMFRPHDAYYAISASLGSTTVVSPCVDIWCTDGTVEGTHILKDGAGSVVENYGVGMAQFDRPFILVRGGRTTVVDLWRTDTTAQGTTSVTGAIDNPKRMGRFFSRGNQRRALLL